MKRTLVIVLAAIALAVPLAGRAFAHGYSVSTAGLDTRVGEIRAGGTVQFSETHYSPAYLVMNIDLYRRPGGSTDPADWVLLYHLHDCCQTGALVADWGSWVSLDCHKDYKAFVEGWADGGASGYHAYSSDKAIRQNTC